MIEKHLVFTESKLQSRPSLRVLVHVNDHIEPTSSTLLEIIDGTCQNSKSRLAEIKKARVAQYGFNITYTRKVAAANMSVREARPRCELNTRDVRPQIRSAASRAALNVLCVSIWIRIQVYVERICVSIGASVVV